MPFCSGFCDGGRTLMRGGGNAEDATAIPGHAIIKQFPLRLLAFRDNFNYDSPSGH
jgi:hypothetical protein